MTEMSGAKNLERAPLAQVTMT